MRPMTPGPGRRVLAKRTAVPGRPRTPGGTPGVRGNIGVEDRNDRSGSVSLRKRRFEGDER